MLRRDDCVTLRQKGLGEHLDFNQERGKFSKMNEVTLEATKTIQSYTSGHFGAGDQEFLSSPEKKREELLKMKEAVSEF
jgi:hypothetical protein